MLYVPRLRDCRLSILALEGAGYAVVFKKEHISIFPLGVDPVDPVLIGHRRDGEYVVCGHPKFGGSRGMTRSESETDKE